MNVYAVAPPPIIMAFVEGKSFLHKLFFFRKEENISFFLIHCLIPNMSVLKQSYELLFYLF